MIIGSTAEVVVRSSVRTGVDEGGEGMSPPIRVLLVEDHPVVLRGLQAMLREHDDVAVVGEAGTAAEALSQASRLQPDVVVLPVRLGGIRASIELCRSIKTASTARVVVFTSFTRTVDVQMAMLAGADALVAKTVSADALLAALRQVRAGGEVLDLGPGADRPTPRLTPAEPLTDREAQILQLVLDGLTNPQMAQRLRIEVTTVRTHMRSILRKLGLESRRDLVQPARPGLDRGEG